MCVSDQAGSHPGRRSLTEPRRSPCLPENPSNGFAVLLRGNLVTVGCEPQGECPFASLSKRDSSNRLLGRPPKAYRTRTRSSISDTALLASLLVSSLLSTRTTSSELFLDPAAGLVLPSSGIWFPAAEARPTGTNSFG